LQRTEKKKGEKNMKRLKKIMALIVASAALLSVVACAGSTTATTTAGTTAAGTAATTTAATKAATTTAAGATTKVGVSMPTKDLQRWNQDGSNMKASLEKAGYTVDLQYASNDVNTQVSQIENMITGGCTILVIAAIDGSSLGTVLATAKTDKIPVIAYDRLIRATIL
jgi:putative multiple sugar transport system substrate-binding protein